MKYVYTSEDHTFTIPLNPPADAGTVTWTLRDQGGQRMADYTNVVIENEDMLSVVPITIVAAANVKNQFRESRFIQVMWASDDVNYTLTYPYVICNFLPVRVTPSDVRTLLALNEAELDDSEVDILQAGSLVGDDIGYSAFMMLLIAGNRRTDMVNQLIAYRAAILLGPSLATRISLNMAVEGNKFSRLGSTDPAAILQALREEYDEIRTVLTNPTYVPVPIFGRSVRPPPKFVSILPPFAPNPVDWPFVGTPTWRD